MERRERVRPHEMQEVRDNGEPREPPGPGGSRAPVGPGGDERHQGRDDERGREPGKRGWTVALQVLTPRHLRVGAFERRSKRAQHQGRRQRREDRQRRQTDDARRYRRDLRDEGAQNSPRFSPSRT